MSGPRRILVAVDASPLSLDALNTAARMARRQGAELAVLHVEDINLSRLSNHPHVMAVSLVSARRLHPGEMLLEGALALQLAEVRRAAERVEPPGGLTLRRGQVAAELLDAARDADLLVIGWCGRASATRLGTTARAVLADAPGPVLVMRRAVREGHPVVLLHDGSPSADRALAFGAALAAKDGGRLDTLLLAPDPRQADAPRRAVEAVMAAHGLCGDIHRLAPEDIGRLRHLAESAPGCLLVTGSDAIRGELDLLRCSVVVVR